MSGDRRLWVHVHIFAAANRPVQRGARARSDISTTLCLARRTGRSLPIGVVRTAALPLKRPPAVATLRRCNRRNRVARARQRAWLLRREAVGKSVSSGRFKTLPAWLEISFRVTAVSCCCCRRR
jgi:hypothetical protein